MLLMPLYLLGLLATIVPVVLHLRRSRRVKRITFSTTRFFDAQFIRSSRRARVQDLLLMLLRVALLAIFVLALSQPMLRLAGLASLTGERRNMVIVIDDSASMNLIDEGGPLLERAKSLAIALVNSLGDQRGHKASVVLAGRRDQGPRVLIAELTSDLEAVRKAIQSIEPTDLATDLNGAVETSSLLLGSPAGAVGARADSGGANSGSLGSGSREIFIFSDLQTSAVTPGASLTAGPGVDVILAHVPARQALARQNISVDAVQYDAPRPMVGVPFTFRALLTNHGDQIRQATTSLVLGTQVVSQRQITLQPGRSQIIRFAHRFTEPGWHEGHIDLTPTTDDLSAAEPDSLPADNQRFFALRVENHLRILAIDGAPSVVAVSDELFYFRLALSVAGKDAAGGALDSKPITIDTLAPAQLAGSDLKLYNLVVLANVSSLAPEALEQLEHYVDAGGSVFIALGDRVDPKAYNNWIGGNRLHGGLLPARLLGLSSAAADGATDGGHIAFLADEHPALAGFADGQMGDLHAVHFVNRYHIDQMPEQTLMRTQTGDPVLVEKRFGRGRVVLFTSSLDRDWTNFPLQSTFVPWLYRLVNYLAQQSVSDSGFVQTGQTLIIPAAATVPEALAVSLPDQSIAYPVHARSDRSQTGWALTLDTTERAGVYTIMPANHGAQATPRALFAANIPDDESVLAELDGSSAADVFKPGTSWAYFDATASADDPGRLARRATGLWDQLLLVALALALFEPLIANRLSRKRALHTPTALSKTTIPGQAATASAS